MRACWAPRGHPRPPLQPGCFLLPHQIHAPAGLVHTAASAPGSRTAAWHHGAAAHVYIRPRWCFGDQPSWGPAELAADQKAISDHLRRDPSLDMTGSDWLRAVFICCSSFHLLRSRAKSYGICCLLEDSGRNWGEAGGRAVPGLSQGEVGRGAHTVIQPRAAPGPSTPRGETPLLPSQPQATTATLLPHHPTPSAPLRRPLSPSLKAHEHVKVFCWVTFVSVCPVFPPQFRLDRRQRWVCSQEAATRFKPRRGRLHGMLTAQTGPYWAVTAVPG